MFFLSEKDLTVISRDIRSDYRHALDSNDNTYGDTWIVLFVRFEHMACRTYCKGAAECQVGAASAELGRAIILLICEYHYHSPPAIAASRFAVDD